MTSPFLIGDLTALGMAIVEAYQSAGNYISGSTLAAIKSEHNATVGQMRMAATQALMNRGATAEEIVNVQQAITDSEAGVDALIDRTAATVPTPDNPFEKLQDYLFLGIVIFVAISSLRLYVDWRKR